MGDIFEDEKTTTHSSKQVFRLYRKLFLLIFGVALLGQSLISVDVHLGNYYRALADSFKIILTAPSTINNEQLSQLGDSLNQKKDIQTVKLFSPQDALAAVRHQNPQLVDSLLLMGEHKMPAYFEITLTPQGINNVRPFVENLAAEYEMLIPHYNLSHAQFVFYAGICSKILHIVLILAVLVFLTFMFLVEATPVAGRTNVHHFGGVVSGLLAGLLACGILAGLVYPTGILAEAVARFTSLGRELLLLAFCGLFGWTLSKWQGF